MVLVWNCKRLFTYCAKFPTEAKRVKFLIVESGIWGVVTEGVITFKSAHKKIIGKYFSHLIVFF